MRSFELTEELKQSMRSSNPDVETQRIKRPPLNWGGELATCSPPQTVNTSHKPFPPLPSWMQTN